MVRPWHLNHPRGVAHASQQRDAWRLSLAVTAALAAAASYGVHHVGIVDAHVTAEALLAVTGTAIAATVFGAAIAPVRAAAPVVVLDGRRVRVGVLGPSEVPFCVELHRDALSHGFFVALGQRFLRKYYRTFIESPHAVAVVATVGGHPVGYLVGTVRARAHTHWVLRHRGLGLAFTAALALAVRPAAAVRFARTRLAGYAHRLRRRRAVAPPTTTSARTDDVAVLSHVAVADGARRSGAGGELVRAFERAVADAGTATAYLTTLEGAGGAGPFYARLGWCPGPTHDTPDGGRMQEWTRSLPAEQAA